MNIDWTQQHCGVHQATVLELIELMPDLKELVVDFEEVTGELAQDFVWDVKVHMLMPSQYPCIPNWHYDNVPRVNNVQDFDLIQKDKPMYLWLSGAPLTEFKDKTVEPKTWTRFTQLDQHRGTMSTDFQWRGFVRATHKDIMPIKKVGRNPLRRHSQVYLDAENFSW